MKRIFALMLLVVMVLFAGWRVAWSAGMFERKFTIEYQMTYTDNTPILAAQDNIVAHIYACTSALDNTTCQEIGAAAPYVIAFSAPSPQQPNTTWWYRGIAESMLYGTTSAFSPTYVFFFRPPVSKPIILRSLQ